MKTILLRPLLLSFLICCICCNQNTMTVNSSLDVSRAPKTVAYPALNSSQLIKIKRMDSNTTKPVNGSSTEGRPKKPSSRGVRHQDGHKSKSGRRYLIYNRAMGQYNNQMMSLQVALCLAKMSNRFVAFGGFIRKTQNRIRNIPEEKSMPLNSFIDVQRARQLNVPIVDWAYFKNDTHPKEKVEMDSFAHFPRHASPQWMNNTIHMGKKSLSSDVTLVSLPILFFWRLSGSNRCNEEDTKWFYSSIIPKPQLRNMANRFIKQKLKMPYAAIHLRRMDGRCKQPIEDVIKRIAAHMIRERFKAVMYEPPYPGVYASGILDMYILSKAAILYTNPKSTLATNAIRYNQHLHKLNSTVVRYTAPELIKKSQC